MLFQSKYNLTSIGELHGIAYQVHQYLLQPEGIGIDGQFIQGPVPFHTDAYILLPWPLDVL